MAPRAGATRSTAATPSTGTTLDVTRVSISLLGPLTINVDQKSVRFSAPPRTFPLLGYLAIHRSKPVQRETIAYTLWPDADEESARANLRRHLHYLGQALPSCGEPWVNGDKRVIQWNPKLAGHFDINEFERRCASPDSRAKAIDLYAGDLLQDLDEEWLYYERERLRSMLLSTLESLIADAAANSDATRTVYFARRLLQVDPWREEALRSLIVARYRLGDRAGALSEYERFERTLRNELSIAPMVETIACYQAISAPIPPPLHEPPRPAAAPAQPAPLPLTGRAQEFERLRTLWSRALRGRGSLALIGGEAGIGKTRLTQELAAHIVGEGIVAIGLTSPTEGTPYHTLADALRMLPLDTLHVEPIWLDSLANVLPSNVLRRTPAAVPQLTPEAEQERIAEAFAQIINSMGEDRPLLMVLEDLHWAGASLLGALEHIARRIGHRPILILGTFREEEVGVAHPLRRLRRQLTGHPAYTQLALSSLSTESVAMALRFVSGLGAEADELARRLHAVSEGNPFYLIEALRDAVENGSIAIHEDRWSIETTNMPDPVPRAARARIADRLSRLTQPAYALAEIGAVAGKSFSVEFLAQLSGWTEADVFQALDDLLDRHILRDGGFGRAEYVFSHHLLQAAVYDSTPPSQRAQRHRRTATLLEQSGEESVHERAAEIGDHYERAGDGERAAPYFLDASERALRIAANLEAIQLADRGLAGAQTAALRYDLLAVRQEATRRELRGEEQRRDLDALLHEAHRLADRRRIGEARLRRILFFRTAGDLVTFEREVDELESEALIWADDFWLAEAHLARCEQYALVNRHEQALRYADKSAALCESTSNEQGMVRLTLVRARIQLQRGQLTLASESIAHAKAVLCTTPDHTLTATLLHADWQAGRYLNDAQRQYDAASEMVAHAKRAGDGHGLARGYNWLGSACDALFRVADARAAHLQALETFDVQGNEMGVANVLQGLVAHYILFGSSEEAIAAASRCEVLSFKIGYPMGSAVGALCLAEALASAQRFAEAREAAARALALPLRHDIPALDCNIRVAAGVAERGLGQFEAAFEFIQDGINIERACGEVESLGDHFSELVTICILIGRLDLLPSIAKECAGLFESLKSSHSRSQAFLWAAAKAQRALGNAEEASTLHRSAKSLLENTLRLIGDEGAQNAYVRFPVNAEIAAAERGSWYPLCH